MARKRTTLVDTSTLTLEEGDRIMEQLARLEVTIAALQTTHEPAILAAKAAYEEAAAPVRAEAEQLEKQLAQVIVANRESFGKVRSRQTSFGEYGLRRLTVISCRKDLLERLIAQNLHGLIRIKKELNKEAIGAALAAGQVIEGATRRQKDTAWHQVRQELLDAARGPRPAENE